MPYFQVNDQCNGCLACVQNCPAKALKHIDEGQKRTLFHNMARCAQCGNCWRVCPREAVEFQHILENEWDSVRTLDLKYCKVCGEPIFTTAFEQTLGSALGQEVESLCPKHRDELALLARGHFFPGGKPSEKGKMK